MRPSRRPRPAAVVLAAVVTSLVVAPTPALAGPWSGSLPATGDVVVAAGSDVTLDRDLDLRTLTVAGTLRCPDDGSALTVHVEAVHVVAGGALRCGGPAAPFTGRLDLVLDGPTDADHLGAGPRSLVVDGLLELHADDRGSGHRTLAAPAAAGATTLRLDDATGLRTGDELVVGSTDFRVDHTERVTVTGVAGADVAITPALAYGHHCGTEAHGARSVRVCAPVGVLSHDIAVRSPAGTIGGHVLARHDGAVRLVGVELRGLGQLGVLGRYPVHLHRVADGTASWVRDSAIVDSNNRFVSIHEAQGVEVTGTVGDVAVGHGFYTEDGSEAGTVFRDNLGLRVADATEARALTPSDTEASVFWVSNPDTVVEGNVAVGGWSGFWLAFGDRAVGLSATTSDALPRTTPLRRFADNTSFGADRAGLFLDRAERADRSLGTTWYSPRVDPTDEDSAPVTPVIEDLTVAKSRGHATWIRTRSGVELRRLAALDTVGGVWTANVPHGGDDVWSTVVDSLVVGESSNVGTAGRWESRLSDGRPAPRPWDLDATLGGVQVYDGPMEVRDTTFANFASRADRRAGALTQPDPNPFSVSTRNRVGGLEFVDANRVWFGDPGPDGNDGTVLTDLDGSLSGTVDARVVTSGALLDDATCDRRASWNAATCGPRGHARLLVIRDDDRSAAVTVTRPDDGRRAVFEHGGRVTYPALTAGTSHRLALATAADGSADLKLMVLDRTGTAPVDLVLPHRGVPDPRFWQGGWRLEEATGPAALATLPQGWWYDDDAELLHLRLATGGLTLRNAVVPAGGGDGSGTTDGGSGTTGGGTTGGSGTTGGGTTPVPTFGDVPSGHLHGSAIGWLASTGITRGCGGGRFCPDASVTRGQMAAFLTRAYDLPGARSRFADTRGHLFEGDAAALARAGITLGCNPPRNDRFCPDARVTRGQMAAFLVRALDLPAGSTSFADMRGHPFAADAAALARAGITRGCNPPRNDRFCPDAPVTRAQMATFLHRAR